ncbi:hypothetical protein N7475_007672 [Penicillium sp. IBT 31633x]|nr:hypothetical protein N7475_007672 [Penicillium sp. IBT 31633x]
MEDHVLHSVASGFSSGHSQGISTGNANEPASSDNTVETDSLLRVPQPHENAQSREGSDSGAMVSRDIQLPASRFAGEAQPGDVVQNINQQERAISRSTNPSNHPVGLPASETASVSEDEQHETQEQPVAALSPDQGHDVQFETSLPLDDEQHQTPVSPTQANDVSLESLPAFQDSRAQIRPPIPWPFSAQTFLDAMHGDHGGHLNESIPPANQLMGTYQETFLRTDPPPVSGMGTLAHISPLNPLRDIDTATHILRRPLSLHPGDHQFIYRDPNDSPPTLRAPPNVQSVSMVQSLAGPTVAESSQVGVGSTQVGNRYTLSSQSSPFPAPAIPYSPERMLQAWLIRQQLLVGIRPENLQPMASPRRLRHRTPPWIILNQTGAYIMRIGPARFEGVMLPMRSLPLIQQHANRDSSPPPPQNPPSSSVPSNPPETSDLANDSNLPAAPPGPDEASSSLPSGSEPNPEAPTQNVADASLGDQSTDPRVAAFMQPLMLHAPEDSGPANPQAAVSSSSSSSSSSETRHVSPPEAPHSNGVVPLTVTWSEDDDSDELPASPSPRRFLVDG